MGRNNTRRPDMPRYVLPLATDPLVLRDYARNAASDLFARCKRVGYCPNVPTIAQWIDSRGQMTDDELLKAVGLWRRHHRAIYYEGRLYNAEQLAQHSDNVHGHARSTIAYRVYVKNWTAEDALREPAVYDRPGIATSLA